MGDKIVKNTLFIVMTLASLAICNVTNFGDSNFSRYPMAANKVKHRHDDDNLLHYS